MTLASVRREREINIPRFLQYKGGIHIWRAARFLRGVQNTCSFLKYSHTHTHSVIFVLVQSTDCSTVTFRNEFHSASSSQMLHPEAFTDV